jgi:hypothetical protein
MLMEWTPKQGGHNFGDFIPSLFDKIFTPASWAQMTRHPSRNHHLIGSVIANDHLRRSIQGGRQPVFWGCGHRGAALDAEAVAAAMFVGCRGTGTRASLLKHGLDVAVVGDPGTLVPIIIGRAARRSEKLLVPHLHDHVVYDRAEVGCDRILSPWVSNRKELVNLIRRISGARFVLAGSLHAAIVASAYGVPFAFFKSEYLDCPPKWIDWASSIALPEEKIEFHQTLREGEQWYGDVKGAIQRTRLLPLLEAAEKIAVVRASAKIRARFYDMGVMPRACFLGARP